MQKIKLTFGLILCVFIVLSCKNKPKTYNVEPVVVTNTRTSVISDELKLIRNMNQDLSEEQITTMNVEADNAIQQLWKDTDKKSWAIITSKVWEYNLIYDGKEMSQSGYLDGYWIEFKDDLTYEYGKLKNVLGTGIYHYTPDTDLLIMRDNNAKIIPNELTAKCSDTELILVGTSRFLDNNMQGRIVALDKIY